MNAALPRLRGARRLVARHGMQHRSRLKGSRTLARPSLLCVPVKADSSRSDANTSDTSGASSAHLATTPSSQPEVPEPVAAETLKLWLKASQLPRDLRLEIFSDGGIGQQVIVVGVMEGSEADKAGIVPGMKLLSISDAIRTEVTWPLGSRPSLRFVKDTVSAIAAGAGKDKEMQMEFTSKAVFTQAPRNSEVNQVSERINRRQERMDVDDQRNDSRVLGITVGLFIGPAVLILAFAYTSGYLDSMYANSLINRS